MAATLFWLNLCGRLHVYVITGLLHYCMGTTGYIPGVSLAGLLHSFEHFWSITKSEQSVNTELKLDVARVISYGAHI